MTQSSPGTDEPIARELGFRLTTTVVAFAKVCFPGRPQDDIILTMLADTFGYLTPSQVL